MDNVDVGSSTSRPPKRKALIIGINYPDREDHLLGPHQDAKELKQLVLRCYDYQEKDIVLMIDEHNTPANLMPTNHNIRREASRLVEGAQAGDHFLFYYAGHADQEPTTKPEESDYEDEEIIPCDDPDSPTTDQWQPILDDDLRVLLVDPLPVGSSLMAVFDSCHSATLLDLDHYHCNDPWNPRRKTSLIAPYDLAASKHHAMKLALDAQTQKRKLSGDVSDQRPRRPPLSSMSSSFLNTPYETNRRRCISLTSKLNERDSQPEASWMVFTRPSHCTGDCPDSDEERANVVSLSACADSQFTWEDPEGGSITRVLIRLLEKDPHPSYNDIIIELSRNLYRVGSIVEQQRAIEPESETSAMSSFQKPQVSEFQISNRKAVDNSLGLHPFTNVLE